MIDPLWDTPARDAPDFLHQSHRLMLRTLNGLEPRLPGILSEPKAFKGSEVMEAAIAALTNPKLDHALKAGALTLLEQRMSSIDPATPRRLYLAPPDEHSPIKASIGLDMDALMALDADLDRHIISERPGRVLRQVEPVTPTAEEAKRAVGLLVTMLVVRLGQCSLYVLPAILERLVAKQPITVLGRWAWLDVDVAGSGPRQLRRIFFDPATLGAWLIARQQASEVPAPAIVLKAGKRRLFWLNYLRKSFLLWQQTLPADARGRAIGSLDRLCDAVRQRIHLLSVPLLATYACGELASTSLETGTWIRLLGGNPLTRAPPETDPDQHEDFSDASEADATLTGSDPGGEADLSEQLTSGALDDHGLVAKLRRAMDKPRDRWATEFDQIISGLRQGSEPTETAELVVRWLKSLAVERRNKGKMLADGSIRHYRGLIVNRLLVLLPTMLNDVGPAELEEAYSEVLSSRRSAAQGARIAAALSSFDRYVRTTHLPDLPRVDLPGFRGSFYDVSARIIVESEYLRGLALINDGDFVVADLASLHRLVAYLGLAFRCGLRRAEILGLQCRDVRNGYLFIEANDQRGLKTRNARRVIPIRKLDAVVLKALDTMRSDRGMHDFLFFDSPPKRKDFESAAVIGHAKSLLGRVTHDSALHVHNLRHSAASLMVIGVLGNEARIEQHPWAEDWMKSASRYARLIDRRISGRLHRYSGRGNAIAMMLGHSSERTTFEHYVHLLDVLLFLTCWSGHFDQPAQNPDQFLYPVRRETGQLLALLGYAPTTLIETSEPIKLINRIQELAKPEFVRLGNAQDNSLNTACNEGFQENDSRPRLPTLRDLVSSSPERERGRPTKQAELDTAAELLQRLNRGYQTDHERLQNLIQTWLVHSLGDDDWASMSPSDAKKWLIDARALITNLPIEARHVSKDAVRKTIKGPIVGVDTEQNLAETTGRYWIRVADRRTKNNRKPSMGGSERSRAQPTITWLLQRVNAQLLPHTSL